MKSGKSAQAKTQVKPKRNKTKQLLVLGVILLLLGVGAGVLYIKSQPYNGWKTATLHYEKQTLRYPKEWKIIRFDENRYIPSGNESLVIQSPDETLSVGITTGYVNTDYPKQAYIRDPMPIEVLGQTYYLGTLQDNGHLVTSTLQVLRWEDKTGVPNKYTASNDICQKDVINPCKVTSFITVSLADPGQPLADYYNNRYYEQARQIIESLTY